MGIKIDIETMEDGIETVYVEDSAEADEFCAEELNWEGCKYITRSDKPGERETGFFQSLREES